MFILTIILLVGVNVCILFTALPFIEIPLDVWHTQGLFALTWLLIMYCWWIKENKPLAFMTLWLGLVTAGGSLFWQSKGKMDPLHFFPFFNFFVLTIFYKIIVSSLTAVQVKKCLYIMRLVVVWTIPLVLLQHFGLSEYFNLYSKNTLMNNLATGFIGNGTLLSCLLGMCAPLFMIKFNREDKLCLIAILGIMLFCGTTKNDPSVSGYITFYFTSLFVSWFRSKKWFSFLIMIGLITAVVGYYNKSVHFLDPQGRTGLWKFYLTAFKEHPIQGWGLGFVQRVFRKTPFPEANKLHFEMYQLAIEAGIIAVICALYMIVDYFHMKTNQFGIYLKAIVFGWLVAGCFNFMAHLWIPSVWIMFVYSGTFLQVKRYDNNTNHHHHHHHHNNNNNNYICCKNETRMD
jgi:O-antigen ligase